jgi:hypothetical protein
MTQTGYRIEIERPQDSDIRTRAKNVRVISAFFFSALIVAVPTIMSGLFAATVDFGTSGCLAGFLLGVFGLGNIAPRRMVVYNPEWRGYVTQDIFRGTMVPYGPGLHASHWWEQRNATGNYSLEVQRQPFDVLVSAGSGSISFAGEYEYAIDLSLIERTVGVSASVVEKGITAFIDNLLTARYADMDTKRVRTQDEIGNLGKELQNELMNRQGSLAGIRNKYGYKTVGIIIEKISLPEDVQKTRNAIDEADALFEVVARLHGSTKEELKADIKSGTVTKAEYQKMLARAMAVSDNKTNINVNVIEGLEGSPAGQVAATLAAITKGGGK